MKTFFPNELEEAGAAIFVADGAPAAHARIVAHSLVQASLLGHDSHGVLRIIRYVEKIARKELDPSAQPKLISATGSVGTVDGGNGFGQVAARFGADQAIALARAHGIGAIAVSRTNHVGRLGEYAEQIAAAGQVALLFASGAGPGGSVAPYGGRERVFGTNPLAWALPVPNGRGPLVADFATSAIPEGKVAVAQARGEPLPPDSLLDAAGAPSTDPAAFYAGGALCAFGGHKGSSLTLFIEVVANLLARAVPASSPQHQPGNPTLIIAIAVEAFIPLTAYQHHLDDLLQRIEQSRPADGFNRVLVPHALERETATRRLRDGIPLPDDLWQALQNLARNRGVSL